MADEQEQAAAQGAAALRPAYRGTFMAELPVNVRLGSVVPLPLAHLGPLPPSRPRIAVQYQCR